MYVFICFAYITFHEIVFRSAEVIAHTPTNTLGTIWWVMIGLGACVLIALVTIACLLLCTKYCYPTGKVTTPDWYLAFLAGFRSHKIYESGDSDFFRNSIHSILLRCSFATETYLEVQSEIPNAFACDLKQFFQV